MAALIHRLTNRCSERGFAASLTSHVRPVPRVSGKIPMSFVWRLNDKEETLRESFAAAVTHLHSPAGPYKSLEDIRRNQNEFGRDFHKGLFKFHVQMIMQILLVEEKLKGLTPAQLPDQRITKRGLEHLRQIFRTFNDCIPWISFPEPSFTINRLCRHRPRRYLRDQNPNSVLKVIAELSKTGETLAIWNDATRCIDLHDVTAISLESRKVIFYEVKEGVVNEEIIRIADGRNEKEIQKSLDELFARRGASGIQQFERFVKQQVEGDKLHALATNDDIEDPFLKKKRSAITPHKPFDCYDSELGELLMEVREREFVSITVDGCLHILAVNQARLRHNVPIDSLIESHLKSRLTTPGPDEPDCRAIMLPFQQTFYSPISMPVMIRPFEPKDVADLCIGNVALFFMFDMNAWGKLFQQCRLAWSSKKDGRRERSRPFLERQMVIDNRVPIITSPYGKSVRLGDRILPIMICEGIRPLSMAEHYDYQLTHSKSDGEREEA
jgi:hypothetical protein